MKKQWEKGKRKDEEGENKELSEEEQREEIVVER